MVSPTDTLKLATFNIRYGYPQKPSTAGGNQWFDGEQPWYARREGLADEVIWEEPDIVGFQEVPCFSAWSIVWPNSDRA